MGVGRPMPRRLKRELLVFLIRFLINETLLQKALRHQWTLFYFRMGI